MPDRYRAVSPMQLVPIGRPQRLLIGGQDRMWGPVGRSYFERAVAVGEPSVEVVEAEDSGHFEMIVPTTSTWPLVRETLAELFAEIEVPIR